MKNFKFKLKCLKDILIASVKVICLLIKLSIGGILTDQNIWILINCLVVIYITHAFGYKIALLYIAICLILGAIVFGAQLIQIVNKRTTLSELLKKHQG